MKVKFWQVKKLQHNNTLPLRGKPASILALSNDGDFLFTGQTDNKATLYKMRQGIKQHHHFVPHSDQMTSANFLLTQKQVVTGSLDGTIKFWDIATASRRHTIDTVQKCYDVSTTRGETSLAAGLADMIKVFDVRERNLAFKLEDAHNSNVTCVKLTPDE